MLGQAESGKSTLQKQFQLIHNPTSLDEERLSWRPVVYYNIVRPVRRIFEVMDAYGELDEDDEAMIVDAITETRISVGSSSQGESSDSTLQGSQVSSTAEKRLATLRYRLGPLLASETSLAERLSDGQPTPAKGNLFVRSGWQTRSLFKGRGDRERGSFTGQRSSIDNLTQRGDDASLVAQTQKDKLIEDVAHILSVCKDDIKELWEHSVVQRLRDMRRLRLEEWAEL